MLVYFIPCIILTFIFSILYFVMKDDAQEEYPDDFISSKGRTITSLNESEVGLIYAKGHKEYKILKAFSYKGEIKKSETILIVKYIDDKKAYMVEPYV